MNVPRTLFYIAWSVTEVIRYLCLGADRADQSGQLASGKLFSGLLVIRYGDLMAMWVYNGLYINIVNLFGGFKHGFYYPFHRWDNPSH